MDYYDFCAKLKLKFKDRNSISCEYYNYYCDDAPEGSLLGVYEYDEKNKKTQTQIIECGDYTKYEVDYDDYGEFEFFLILCFAKFNLQSLVKAKTVKEVADSINKSFYSNNNYSVETNNSKSKKVVNSKKDFEEVSKVFYKLIKKHAKKIDDIEEIEITLDLDGYGEGFDFYTLMSKFLTDKTVSAIDRYAKEKNISIDECAKNVSKISEMKIFTPSSVKKIVELFINDYEAYPIVLTINKDKKIDLSIKEFNGLTFVITGDVHKYKNRDELKKEIESLGGKVTGSVTSKTAYLINNDISSASSKNKKAKELGIKIITEDEYINMIKQKEGGDIMENNEFEIEKDALMHYTGNEEVVVIPDGIKEIENNAFCGKSLKKVTIPNSVRKIHYAAFAGSSLEEIVIPDSVEKIGNFAFGYCKNLKKVTITNGVKVIDGLAFASSSLEEIIIPDSVTEIGYRAFLRCKKLKKITIPDSINVIEDHTFYKSGLEEIVIPESVKEIESWAFSDCKKLKTVKFADINKIKTGNKIFENCKSLVDKNGMLIIQNCLFECNSNDNDIVVIPNTVTKIDTSAFKGKLVHLEMPIVCPNWDQVYSRFDTSSLLHESGSSITFKDKEGKKIAYIVLSIDGEIDSIRNGAILSIKSKNGQFDFKSYDAYLKSLEVTENKINVALARLEYPYKLSPEMTKVYESCIKDNAEKVGKILIDEDRLDTLQLIGEKGLFTSNITKKLTKYATNKNNTSITAYLLNLSNQLNSNLYKSKVKVLNNKEGKTRKLKN